ncbi:flagellar hook protein FlgE [Nitratidesulfovibrio sp. HK-II]|uniref:flagellar hook protein FlgE n=1 Tax=Nitratidesulfovibrio sp. HK-II TaxID=2009266 RepID=UPI000E2ED3B8|nr:flagellar hook protein FlgE [Nitratidesulfovibrio sp. HK-II]GBO97939.1 flagellar hook protein FlgE [Nitratidesulfovibrio sp. HK-II]
MGLSSSMYTSVSGLQSTSESISVIGNNLANSSTTGYKSMSMLFEDVFYSSLTTSSGLDQVGNGSTVSTISTDFSQGSYQDTSESMNMAIGGEGYFIVEDAQNDGQVYYTRAGDFTFDDEGYLVNSSGYQVQGWAVDPDTATSSDPATTGALGDIQLESRTAPASATTNVTLSVNLDSDGEDNATSTTDPYFSLLTEWDGSADDPLGTTDYEYQTTITVYDEAGSAHELTVYFDQVEDSTTGTTTWEYIVTMDPSEDVRTINGQSVSGTSAAGLLMAGTLTFDATGALTSTTAFTLSSTATGDLTDLSNWTLAEISADGLPVFSCNFSGSDNASTTDEADAIEIELDFGVSAKSTTDGWDTTVTSAADIGTDGTLLFGYTSTAYDTDSSTSHDSASSTDSSSQDGYATGYLTSYYVDEAGVIYGTYSNGQTQALFIVALASFDNDQGLNLEGGNLYSATTESGTANIGQAGQGIFGSIYGEKLEESNVDVSGEMVDLIVMQRAYQANSKVITTVDEMLQTALGLKR